MAWAGSSLAEARRVSRDMTSGGGPFGSFNSYGSSKGDRDSLAPLLEPQKKRAPSESDDGNSTPLGNCGTLLLRLREEKIKTCMLITVPFGMYSANYGWPAYLRFWLNFMALIPLSALLGMATEDVSTYTNEVQAGLINATFGNVVEMMVTFMALRYGEIQVVQSTLLGSILSNLLFVLGSCVFYGGIKAHELRTNAKSGAACTSLLLLATGALMLPTSVSYVMDIDKEAHDDLILNISRFTAVVIFIVYLQFLYFQLYSHKDFFDAAAGDSSDDGEAEDEPRWSMKFAILILALTSVLTAYSSDCLVASVEDYSEDMGLSKAFIGLILVASVGNVPEFYVTLMVAANDQLDLALTIAVGSACQMALFVTPFTVMVAWFMDTPMTLDFHVLPILCLILSVLVVSSVIQSGSATWLQGSLLVGTYFIIAVIFFCLPKDLEI